MRTVRTPVAVCLGMLLCALCFIHAVTLPSPARGEFAHECGGISDLQSPAAPVAPQGDGVLPGDPGPAQGNDLPIPVLEEDDPHPAPTPSGEEEPLPEETPPEDGEEWEPELPPEPPEEAQAGELPTEVWPGQYAVVSAMPGERFTLAIPVYCVQGDMVYTSNEDAYGETVPYQSGHMPSDYDQAIGEALREVTVTLLEDQGGEHALTPESLWREDVLLADGVNRGYAVFEDLQLAEDAEPRLHSVQIRIAWVGHDGIAWDTTATVRVEVIPHVQLVEYLGDIVNMGDIALLEEATEDSAGTGDVTLGRFTPPSAAPGGQLTLDIPLLYAEQAPAAGGEAVPEQALSSVWTVLEVTIAAAQAEDFPLEQQALSQSRQVVLAGDNLGYALFEALPISAEAGPGEYAIRVEVSWPGAEGDQRQSRTLDVPILVEANGAIGDAMRYGDNGVIVFTHTQLKAMLETTQFDPIYLGYCAEDMPPGAWETKNNGMIQYPADRAASGIAITRGVTIIGTDPRNGQRLWLVDNPKAFSEGADTDGMHIDSGISLTLRDVSVAGYSCSGIISSRAGGASISFVNVDYTGCRMFCTTASNNSLSFTGCDIAIQSMDSGGARAQEVARLGAGGRVNLYGTNIFKRDGGYVSGYDHAMFWLSGTSTFTVHEGAYAKVDANNYFLREQSGAALVVNGAMDVTTNGGSGCMTYDKDVLRSCTVSGALSIRHNSTSNPSLRVYRLNVSGTLSIIKQHYVAPCIMLSSGGQATFSSPQSVTLVNTGGFVMRAEDGSATVSITTQAMNLSNFTGRRIWNNNDLRSFTVTNTLSNTGTRSASVTGLLNNRGVALGAQQLTKDTCNFGYANILTFGQYSAFIDSDTVYYGSDRIRGRAPSGSTQVIEEYAMQGTTLGSRIQSVAASGSTSFQTGGDWRAVSTTTSRVYLLSTLDNLQVHTYRDTGEACLLRDVPAELDFGTVTVAGEAQWVDRLETDWTIQVVDTRRNGSWTLKANATPLTATDGSDTLPDALVFVRSDGTWTPLSPTAAVVVAQKGANDGQGMVEISWPLGRGLCVYLDVYEGTPGMGYDATITWTLAIE